MNAVRRVYSNQLPFVHYDWRHPYNGSLPWPCQWITCPAAGEPPFVTAYRLRFTLEQSEKIHILVTADERYELYVDGERVGRGPERGDGRNWFYEEYELTLPAGPHLLAARTWALGPYAPIAQFSLKPGFLLCAVEERFWEHLNTGRAAWETCKLEGYAFTPSLVSFGVGYRIDFDARRFLWGFELGNGNRWMPALAAHPGYHAANRGHADPDHHLLRPAQLPPMMEEPRFVGKVRNISAPALSQTHSIPVRAEDHLSAEEPGWGELLAWRSALTIPPHTRRRVIIDLENYYCAYPEAVVSGGKDALLRIHWQEGLFREPGPSWDRDNRDTVEGKYFTTMRYHQDGLGDSFWLDGGEHRIVEPLWWNAGRYVEVLIETDNDPLTIERFCLRETRYPYENASRFQASDPRLETVIPVAVRGLQMCSHETYMDCPYYEQLMYVGDTRLECLVTYLTSPDDRLPRKAIEMFAQSRLPSGLTQSRYPSRERQIIPPFSLWWVGMVHDYWMWRGGNDELKQWLPVVRSVMDAFTNRIGADGLVRSPEGWNYIDWVEVWEAGVPPGGRVGGVCGPLNWQYVYALAQAAELEEHFGEPEMAVRARRLAKQAAESLRSAFWDAGKGLLADDDGHTIYTEHSQCLALLADTRLPGLLMPDQRETLAERLFSTPGLTRPTVYFLHYLLETCRELGRMDIFLERLQPWFDMPKYGFKTTYENADPHANRSDCHAWGAHPLYHYFASLLGIRPSSPGFATVAVHPQLGPLEWASGTIQHPAGALSAEIRKEDGRLSGTVTLPQGITGILHANGQQLDLHEGLNAF